MTIIPDKPHHQNLRPHLPNHPDFTGLQTLQKVAFPSSTPETFMTFRFVTHTDTFFLGYQVFRRGQLIFSEDLSRFLDVDDPCSWLQVFAIDTEQYHGFFDRDFYKEWLRDEKAPFYDFRGDNFHTLADFSPTNGWSVGKPHLSLMGLAFLEANQHIVTDDVLEKYREVNFEG